MVQPAAPKNWGRQYHDHTQRALRPPQEWESNRHNPDPNPRPKAPSGSSWSETQNPHQVREGQDA